MHFSSKDKHRFKRKGREKEIPSKRSLKAGVAILISEKTDFKAQLVRRNKDHFILMKATIHQEDITIINIYGLNLSTSNFIEQTQQNIKGQVNPTTINSG
jgi:hypothetical protein